MGIHELVRRGAKCVIIELARGQVEQSFSSGALGDGKTFSAWMVCTLLRFVWCVWNAHLVTVITIIICDLPQWRPRAHARQTGRLSECTSLSAFFSRFILFTDGQEKSDTP